MERSIMSMVRSLEIPIALDSVMHCSHYRSYGRARKVPSWCSLAFSLAHAPYLPEPECTRMNRGQ